MLLYMLEYQLVIFISVFGIVYKKLKNVYFRNDKYFVRNNRQQLNQKILMPYQFAFH